MWETITSDEWILNTLRGCKVGITTEPQQDCVPKPFKFITEESHKINDEINRFLKCGIIEVAPNENENVFISNIFIRHKINGNVRVILKLKTFNDEYVEKTHFKMESLRQATKRYAQRL